VRKWTVGIHFVIRSRKIASLKVEMASLVLATVDDGFVHGIAPNELGGVTNG
jgi:hypothetical protein